MAQSIQEKREERRRRREEEANSDEAENKGITESKGRATPSRRKGETSKAATTSSSNFLVRSFSNTRDYFVGVRDEVKKVTWPDRDETSRLTRIVLVVLVASALFLGGLSILFTEIFSLGVQQPWVFILVFVAFIGVLFAYARFSAQSDVSEF